MAKRKRLWLRISGWIILGLFSLILLLSLVFYLGRERFLFMTVNWMNEKQAGEVQMGKMNLIPFMDFPDVALQLRKVEYFESKFRTDSAFAQPILSLDEIYVTLDVLELIKGKIQISELHLKDGHVRFETYTDSLTNLEHALGFPWVTEESEAEVPDSTEEKTVSIDLDRIALSQVSADYYNQVSGDEASFFIKQLDSRFSYRPDRIDAGLELDVDINKVKYLTINEEKVHSFYMDGSMSMNTPMRIIHIEPSQLRIFGLDLEVWGHYDYGDSPEIDVKYQVSNEGLETLNFLLRGILNLDELEQTGEGHISLNGAVSGALGDQLPLISMEGSAEELAFRIKSLGEEVRGISFQVEASNGASTDFSQAFLEVDDFRALLPDGYINANIKAKNAISPEVKVQLNAKSELQVLEKIIKNDHIENLRGSIQLSGSIQGIVDRVSGEFKRDTGSIRAVLDEVGFLLHRDSLKTDQIKDLNGLIFLRENLIGVSDLNLDYAGNHMELDFCTSNVLDYFLEFDRDIEMDLDFNSEVIYPAKLISDTSITGILGEEIRGFRFQAAAKVKKQEMDRLLKGDSLPCMEISLDSFAMASENFAEIKYLQADLGLGPDTLDLHAFMARIGESDLQCSARITNYGSLNSADSLREISLGIDFSSRLLRAEDLLQFKGDFLLPETLHEEHMEDFRLNGEIRLPSLVLVQDSVEMDLRVDVSDMDWKFRYYPHEFKNFEIHAHLKGDRLLIDSLSGDVGESNLLMSASIDNFRDSLVENISGQLMLKSDLLDFNKLLSYHLPQAVQDTSQSRADSVKKEAPRLDQISFPAVDFTVDIGELHYDIWDIYGMEGQLRSTRDKIFYLDDLRTSTSGGGEMILNGYLSVADSTQYTVSAEVNIDQIDVNDLGLEFQSGDEVYTLQENFNGVISAHGLAEIYVQPDLKIDIPMSTAMFNVTVDDGALIQFTPLKAAEKALDDVNLDHVRFDRLQNSFTLIDSHIQIPLMKVESNIGLLLIEGEQGLDNSYLYLLRVPKKMAVQAARNVISSGEGKEGSDEIRKMQRGDFVVVTVWSDGKESDYKLGDKREKFRE